MKPNPTLRLVNLWDMIGSNMDLKEHSDRLVTAIGRRLRRAQLTSRFVRFVLVIAAAAIAGMAQFAEFPSTGATSWQIAGIAATCVVAIGAIWSAIVDDDASEELRIAHRAVEHARDVEERNSYLDTLDNEFTKMVGLYQVMDLSRGAIERGINIAGLADVDLIARMMEACRRSVPIAMGFAQADIWTVCAYRAEPGENGKTMLRCIAQVRAIECSIEEARSWEAGTGIAGSCYANLDEVIVPDLQTPGLRAVFGSAANVAKTDDALRYRSMAAVPILVDGADHPWGVISATNDKVDHFAPEQSFGIQAVEVVRALAAMAALAIACRRGA